MMNNELYETQSAVLPGRDSLKDLLSWGKEELVTLGSRESQTSAEWILADLLDISRSAIYANALDNVPVELKERYQEAIRARKQGVPVAYVTGRAAFWEEVLNVGPGCLIPRPETERLVETVIHYFGFGKDSKFEFLDLGCGSGAIGTALLRHFPNAKATFSDISEEALFITRKNIEAYGLSNRVEVVRSDLFSQLRGRRWNAIVSNPPYLSLADWQNVQPELLKEPRLALDGGEDGYDFYRHITREANEYLYEDGWLALEVGIGQARTISSWLESKNFKHVQRFEDYADIDRVVIGQKRMHG